jgi:hypothetical protein
MLTVDVFLTKFPEFEGRINEDVLESLIQQIELETNSYSGLDNFDIQTHAIALRVAFEIESYVPTNAYLTGNIKRIESLEDVIEYNTTATEPGDYSGNKYGVRLKRFLTANYYGGFTI